MLIVKILQSCNNLIKPFAKLKTENEALLNRTVSFAVKAQNFLRKRLTAVITISLVMIIIPVVLINVHSAKQDELARTKAEKAYAQFRGNQAGEEKIIEIAPGVQMTFCWCPPGEFTVGNPMSGGRRSKEKNEGKVILSKGFWMSKTEVTQAQWMAVMGIDSKNFTSANLPVVFVSWNNIQDFLQKADAAILNDKGCRMLLPTEAQWEYAAMADEPWFFSGSGNLDDVGWYRKNSSDRVHQVGEKKANAWGLQDMSGNVLEWCQDWYDGKLEGGIDPKGPSFGESRVVRGGRWSDDADDCQIVSREDGYYPAYSHYSLGFRVVLSSVPESQ